MEQNNNMTASLSLIESATTEIIPVKVEVIDRFKEYVSCGKDNKFPQYLYDTFKECSSLQSIINGTADFICGNGMNYEFTNSLGETLSTIIRKMSIQLLIYGGFYLRIKKSPLLKLEDILVLDYKNCRVNEDLTFVYYSKKFGQWGAKAEVIPMYTDKQNDSVIFYRGVMTSDDIYPTPKYYSALKACRTQIEIQNFHFNSIKNNFSANTIINMNNGVPTEEVRKDIEKKLTNKFTGTDNATKFLISWNDNKDNATTVERVDDDQFDERYNALFKTTINTIFSVMNAQPVLFGQVLENVGFNTQEYEAAFALYNRTVVLPIQTSISDILSPLFGVEKLDIIPFSLNI